MLRELRPPGLEVPNFVPLGVPAPRVFDAYGEWMQTPPPTWDDVAWLRDLERTALADPVAVQPD